MQFVVTLVKISWDAEESGSNLHMLIYMKLMFQEKTTTTKNIDMLFVVVRFFSKN